MKKEDLKIYLETLISLLSAHIYWKDKNGAFLACNNAQAISAGFSCMQEMVGKTDYDMPWQDDADEIRKNDQEVMKNRKSVIKEEVSLLANGENAVFLSHKVPLINKKKQVIGILGVSIDITDRKKAEEYRRKQEIAKKEAEIAQKEAEASKKAAEFATLMAGAVAHELRTPLSAINSNVVDISQQLPKLIETYELAKSHGLDVPKIRPWRLELLQTAAQDIAREINFSRSIIDMLLMNISGTKIDPQTFKRCSIANCIEGALARYPFTDEEKELVSFKRDEDFEFMGDSLLIIHALFNLIKNALHSLAKAGKGEITIWLEPGANKKGGNKLHFKDTGAGIPEGTLPQIFESFFTKTYGGTGIGLSFCKKAMEGLGGGITCISQKNKFTEFILTFPNLKSKNVVE